MSVRKTVEYQGRDVEGTVVDFETVTPEVWNQYKTEDGSTIKLKVIILEIVKLDEVSATGDPIYVFAAQQIVGVSIPEEAKRSKVG